MAVFSQFQEDNTIQQETDYVGGYSVLDSGLYKCSIQYAYAKTAQSGAMAFVLCLSTDKGVEINQTFWISSGKDKGCSNTFINKDGQKQYLPGWLMADGLAHLTVGKGLRELEDENKLIKLYNYEVKAEVATQVPMFTELLGKEVAVGIVKQIVNKRIKTDDGYVDSDETREINEVVKFFDIETLRTISEVRAGTEEAEYVHKWLERNKDKVVDKTNKDAVAKSPISKASGSTTGTSRPAKSLFN